MRAGEITTAPADVLSILTWWQLAGVDVAIDEAPRDWRIEAPVAPTRTPPAAPQPPTLAAVQAELLALDIPGAPTERLGPEGDPVSGLMLLVDMPDPGDAAEGRLLAGEVGRLFENMLAAIGRDRASVYLAPMLSARPAGGRVPGATAAQAEALARDHVALAAPRMLLLCGDAASRAILGTSFAEARHDKQTFNHRNVTVPVVATFHPRFLLQRPALKAEAWKDLRRLLEELDQ